MGKVTGAGSPGRPVGWVGLPVSGRPQSLPLIKAAGIAARVGSGRETNLAARPCCRRRAEPPVTGGGGQVTGSMWEHGRLDVKKDHS